jgi:hypothetical protein
MSWIRRLGIALIPTGIALGIATFLFLSYGIITGASDGVEWHWFWQGPVLGSTLAIAGAILAVLSRRTQRGSP